MVLKNIIFFIFLLLIVYGNNENFAQEDSVKYSNLIDLSLEDLMKIKVVVASKKIELVNEAPGIITVISKSEIQGLPAKNLGDILNRVVGAAFVSPDVFQNSTVVIRGQEITPYNNHVLILLNGRPLRDPLTGGLNGSVYSSFPINIIDRIEIIRGPGSVLYGSCAFSGVINIITRKTEINEFDANASIEYGSYNYFSQKASAVLKTDDLEFSIGLNNHTEDGPEYYFTDYTGKYSGHNFFQKNKSVFVNGSYKNLTVNALYSKIDPYSLNGSEYWDVSDYGNAQTSIFADLRYNYEFNNNYHAEFNFTYNQHNWEAQPQRYDNIGKSYLVEWQMHNNNNKNLNYIFGGGYEYADWNQESLFIAGSLQSFFLYTQFDFTISNRIKLIGGLQFNKIERIDGNLSPRIGIITSLSDNFTLKLLYSQAFRRAYANETNFAIKVFQGNNMLEPENIKTFEAQLSYASKSSSIALTLFHSNIYDLISRLRFEDASLAPPFYFKYFNLGNINSWGFELESKFSLFDNLIVINSLSYQTNEKDGIDNALLHPNTMFKTGLLYSKSTYSLGIQLNYVSQGYSTQIVSPASKIVNASSDSYLLLSLKASYFILGTINNRSLEISGQVDNILDIDIRYPDYPNKGVNTLLPPRNGRNFQISLKYYFN